MLIKTAKETNAGKKLGSFSMIEQVHAAIPGFFKTMKKTKFRTSVEIPYGNKRYELTIRQFRQLDVFDMSIFLAILSLARNPISEITKNATANIQKKLRTDLELDGDAIELNNVVIYTSMPELIDHIGKIKSSHLYKSIKDSLVRLTSTSIVVDDKETREHFSFNLLSSHVKGNGEIRIALNPFLSLSLSKKKPYSLVSTIESRKIKSEHGKLLHYKLSTYIRQSQSAKLKESTLLSYLYPPDPNDPNYKNKYDSEDGKNLKRAHKLRLKKAIFELIAIGWEIKQEPNDILYIKRPKLPDGENELDFVESKNDDNVFDTTISEVIAENDNNQPTVTAQIA